MMSALNRISESLSSLRLTVFCLAVALVLVTVGTLMMPLLGIYTVQEHFFQSWIVWRMSDSGGFSFPIYPGGHLIGAVLLVNLIAAIIHRFSFTWRKAGIQLIHFGIIIMLVGGLASDLMSVTSTMRIAVGDTKNYAEDTTHVELAVINHSDPQSELVTAVPDGLLAERGSISHESLPFRIVVRQFNRNSEFTEVDAEHPGAKPAASNGVGARVAVAAKPLVSKTDERDIPSAVVEIIPAKGGKSLGTWLVTDLVADPQEFELDGSPWSVQLRFARHYYPCSMTLRKFTHNVYPGTDIPKEFASTIMLDDEEHHEHRQVVINMNHPLRYLGETFYQYKFATGDGGTILQVVRNPGWQMPYVACVVVSLGLLVQFTVHLVGFVSRRAKQITAS